MDIKKELNYIKWYSFDQNRLSMKEPIIDKENKKKKFYFMNPYYKYNDKISKSFTVKTPFIKLTENPFPSYTFYETGKYILIDPNNDDVHNFINIFEKYDILTKNILENTEYKEQNPLIRKYNAVKYKHLKLFLTADTKIINYNVSKDYPRNEIITDLSKSTLSRPLKKDKEIRIIASPYTWIDISNKTYGSKLVVHLMEIKYSGSNNYSLVDTHEKIEQEEPPTIVQI